MSFDSLEDGDHVFLFSQWRGGPPVPHLGCWVKRHLRTTVPLSYFLTDKGFVSQTTDK